MVLIGATLILNGAGQYRVSAIRAVERDMRPRSVGLRQAAVMIKEEIREIHFSCSKFQRRDSSREGVLFRRAALQNR